MADALQPAIRFTTGRVREDLDSDQILTFALVHALQIVGEAPSRISSETREKYSHVPWATVIGMRHRLVHAYVDIDTNIVWTTAVEAAPALLAQIAPLLDAN